MLLHSYIYNLSLLRTLPLYSFIMTQQF